MTLMVTQLVSGVWHGLYPGYILFFAGSAIFFAHSTVIYNWEKALMPLWLANSFPWWALKVFCTKQGLDFLAMAFLWLTWKECMLVWASVYWLPLLYMIAVLVLGRLFPVKARKQKPAGQAAAEQQQTTENGTFSSSKHSAAAVAPATAGGGGDDYGEEEVVTGDLLHLGEGIKSALVDGSGSRPELVSDGVQQQQ